MNPDNKEKFPKSGDNTTGQGEDQEQKPVNPTHNEANLYRKVVDAPEMDASEALSADAEPSED